MYNTLQSVDQFYVNLSVNKDNATIKNSVPRLECLAVAKVAIQIYSHPDVTKFELEDKYAPFHCTPNEEWEPFLREKISTIPLPEMLQEMVIGLIKPLSLQHLTWKQFHALILKPSFPVIKYLIWTSMGMIDLFKTAKRLIHGKDLTFLERFVLVCIYCLKDDLWILWENASEAEIKNLVYAAHSTNEYHYKQVLCKWFNWLEENVEKCPAICRTFLSYIDVSNTSSLPKKWSLEYTEFFLAKKRTYLNIRCRHPLFTLLFQMQQSKNLYEKEPFLTLSLYLQWPLQIQFNQMADQLMGFMTDMDFINLLCIMSDKIEKNWKDFDYVLLLNDFWKKGPDHFIRYAEKNISFMHIRKHISL